MKFDIYILKTILVAVRSGEIYIKNLAKEHLDFKVNNKSMKLVYISFTAEKSLLDERGDADNSDYKDA